MAGIRIASPKTAQNGEVVEIKALLQHKMESGYRYDNRGNRIARDIITRFECRYDDIVVFAADFGPGIAANPYLSFYIRTTHSGELAFKWSDQNGETWQESRSIEVA